MEAKTCVIGLKRGLAPSGHVSGEVFHELQPCCNTFKRWFEDTGNIKVRSFNHTSSKERNGFNLTSRGWNLVLELLADNDPSTICKVVSADSIKFCPFCGAKIEIKVVKVVELRDKFEKKRVGYEEVELKRPRTATAERMHEGDLR